MEPNDIQQQPPAPKRPSRRGGCALFGCSFTSLVLVAVALAATVWSVATYVRLSSAEVDVEQAWSGVENACLHRMDLAADLTAVLARTSLAGDPRVAAVEDGIEQADRFVATPRIVEEPERFERFREVQIALGTDVDALLDAASGRVSRRDADAIERIAEQLRDTGERLAEARRRYDVEVRSYARLVRTPPEAWIAALAGFRTKELWDGEDGSGALPDPSRDL